MFYFEKLNLKKNKKIVLSGIFPTKTLKIMKSIVKNIAVIATVVVANVFVAQAQDTKPQFSTVGDSVLNSYKEQRLEDSPWVQAYQVIDGPRAGQILKAADATGWGIEAFAGASMTTSGFITPQGGLSIRYDAKKVTYRLSASVLQREYNEEAINSGKRYMSYAADAAFHFNLCKWGYYENFLSLYANVGYIFGKHSYKVGEAEVEEGTIVSSVRHNGSGLTFGGGIEYRRQMFATGNAWTVRVGYDAIPNTFVNNTKRNGMLEGSVGFVFGANRKRVK